MKHKPFSLLIKPASADCNLRCEYCFYLGHASFYPETRVHRMSGEVLDRLISSYMATEQAVYSFGWQGGEPTVMGLDFFKLVTSLQKKYGKPGTRVANGLQTNATLIDDAFAAHLGEYNFLLGVSLDGPAALHDAHRRNAAGAPTHGQVLRAITCLERNRVEFNILTLVNDVNVSKGREVYRYLCEQGWHYHQYIPCVEFGGNGHPLPFSISGPQWGEFLCGEFDERYAQTPQRASIRLFDSILEYLLYNRRNICHLDSHCCQYFVVEYNGDIFPCDFFVEKELRLGNIDGTAWETALASPVYQRFGGQKSAYNEACTNCPWLFICQADCMKHRFYGNRDPRSLSWLCEGWKLFYNHAMPAFNALADQIRRQEIAAARSPNPGGAPGSSPVGRNDPCPCGSGKKYKKCCLLKKG